MKKIITYIKNHWLSTMVIILPIIDIISYFLIDNVFGNIITILRLFIMVIIFIYSYIIADNKKSHYIFTGILCIYLLGHILSCFISGYINIAEDIANILRIINMPVLLFSFTKIFKYNNKSEQEITKGILVAFLLTLISIIISLITETANYTYGSTYELGIIGWFFSKNSQSLILITLALISGAYSLKKKTFYIISILIYLVLYFNATKTAYLSLILYLLIVIFYSIFEIKDIRKILFSILLLTTSLFAFNVSPTYKNLSGYVEKQSINNIQNNNLIDEKESTTPAKIEENNNNITQDNYSNTLTEYDTLYRKYSLGILIDNFGIQNVVEEYNYSTDAFILSNTRTKKKVAARLIYNEESVMSHLFGFEFTKINNINYNKEIVTLDLENDFTALFYYLGHIGLALYLLFILYYVIKILKVFFKNIRYIFNIEYMIWIVLIFWLLIAGEYTGALLRRPSANIYLSIIVALSYVKSLNFKYNNIQNNKISFLLLHLGYGGIESSTINTANSLCDKYNVEIISFYKLKENQEKKLNTKINVKFLYNSGPNKEEFFKSLKQKKIINILKEGIKSFDILIKKKLLLIKYIQNCDSKYIVSTRVEFSEILSKYGKENTIKIAQEHHHHNNDSKYIKRLSKHYKNINYLCALTSSLEHDYKIFLKNNKYTKIILLPNMIYEYPNKQTTLKYKNIISVGRLDKGKKIDELIKIFSKIENKETNLFIIGDGKEYDNLKSLIKKLKLEKRAHLLGFLDKDQIEEYMLKSCLFLMTSISEGLPMVLLEAMSYGVPCIAYETSSGINDIIDDNQNGYIIANRDEKKYLKCINDFLENNQKMKAFSNNAKQKAKTFSKEQILEKWSSFLQ